MMRVTTMSRRARRNRLRSSRSSVSALLFSSLFITNNFGPNRFLVEEAYPEVDLTGKPVGRDSQKRVSTKVSDKKSRLRNQGILSATAQLSLCTHLLSTLDSAYTFDACEQLSMLYGSMYTHIYFGILELSS